MEGEFDKISSIGMFEHVGIAQPPGLFPGGAPAAAAPRALPAPHHCAPRQAHRQGLQAQAGIQGADPLHLSRRRARPSRHVGRQSRAFRFRGPRRRRLARALPAHDAPVVGATSTPAAPKPRRRSGPRRPRMWLLYLAGCSLAFERGAVGSTRRWARSAYGVPPACRRRERISIADLQQRPPALPRLLTLCLPRLVSGRATNLGDGSPVLRYSRGAALSRSRRRFTSGFGRSDGCGAARGRRFCGRPRACLPLEERRECASHPLHLGGLAAGPIGH